MNSMFGPRLSAPDAPTAPLSRPASLYDGPRHRRSGRIAAMRRDRLTVRSEGGPSLVALFSRKGGVGVSVTAALLAAVAAEDPRGALLVDLVGDQEAVLGLPVSERPGVTDWLTAPDIPTREALTRLEWEVADGFQLLPVGGSSLREARHLDELMTHLESEGRTVVIDCGRLPAVRPNSSAGASAVAVAVVERARTAWIVSRDSYLSVQASATAAVEPNGCILLTHEDRALGPRDVHDALGVPIVLDLALDRLISRLVDAGLLVGRVPRDLRRVLHSLLAGAQ